MPRVITVYLGNWLYTHTCNDFQVDTMQSLMYGTTLGCCLCKFADTNRNHNNWRKGKLILGLPSPPPLSCSTCSMPGLSLWQRGRVSMCSGTSLYPAPGISSQARKTFKERCSYDSTGSSIEKSKTKRTKRVEL